MRLKAGTTRFKVGSSSRALWLACLLLFMPAAYAETVKIGIEPRAPLFELGQDGAPTGLYVDLLQDFVERHNWDVLFIDGQTPDLLQQLREQNLDMVVGVDADNVVGDGLELLEPALFTQWIQVYRPFPSLWQRWTEARWDNLQDLSEKRLGVVAKSPAYQHTQKICKLLPTSCNLALFESMSQLLAALRNEKIDAIVVDTLAASYHQLNFHANPSALIFAPAPINIAIAKNTVASKRNELRDMLAFWQRDRPPEYEQIVWHSYPQRAQKPQILPAQHLVIGLGIGFLIGLIGILLVIRNHKSKPIIVTKEDLDHESRRYQVLINSIPYGLQEIDTKGRILFSNAAEHQMRRYKFGELQGHSIFDMMAFEREKKALREYFKRILKQQPEPEHYYCTITRKDGEMAELRVEWSYKRDPHGNITGFFGLVSDVTETEQTKYRIVEQQKTMTQVVQKRTEDLKEAYNDLLMAATVFEYTDQGILVLKPNNLVESANPAFLRQSGYTEDELPNLTLKSFSAERHGPKFHASLEARLKDKTFWQGEFWLARRNGKHQTICRPVYRH